MIPLMAKLVMFGWFWLSAVILEYHDSALVRKAGKVLTHWSVGVKELETK